ncbi:recombinase family protein [Streptomyces sp. NPDC001156]
MTGREYLRVSAKGERSIPEQRDDNTRAAEREGVALGRPYQDQGSASRYARTNRDDFDRLTDDLKNGQFGADLLWLWESSRGSRRVGEWVTLIELCEENAVRVYVTTHGRVYNPADPRDRRSLLEDAVDSEYESAKIKAHPEGHGRQRPRRQAARHLPVRLRPRVRHPARQARPYPPVPRPC